MYTKHANDAQARTHHAGGRHQNPTGYEGHYNSSHGNVCTIQGLICQLVPDWKIIVQAQKKVKNTKHGHHGHPPCNFALSSAKQGQYKSRCQDDQPRKNGKSFGNDTIDFVFLSLAAWLKKRFSSVVKGCGKQAGTKMASFAPKTL